MRDFNFIHPSYHQHQHNNGVFVDHQSYFTPMIVEKALENQVVRRLEDKLLEERIIQLVGPVNDLMSTTFTSMILYLETLSTDPIKLYVDSPGGSVKSGLTMVDLMNQSKCEFEVINTGMAASMGSILLGAGTKGKRKALPNSRVMIHQVSGGAQGTVTQMGISYDEAKKYNDKLMGMLADFTGKTKEEVIESCINDLWLNAEEALEYGIIDEIILT